MGSRRRTPPTPDQILGLLTTFSVLDDDRAAPLQDTYEVVRQALRTTGRKAEEWVLAAATGPDAPLAVINSSGGIYAPARDLWEQLTGHGWTTDTAYGLRFAHGGQRVSATSTQYDGTGRPWVVLRPSLQRWQQEITAELAAERQRWEHQQAQELAAFRALHGDALDVISAFLAPVPQPLPDRMIRTNPDDILGDFYGSAGTLIIQLQGDQIERAAELLADLQARAAAADTTVRGRSS